MAAPEENGELNGIDSSEKDNIDAYPQIYTELQDSDFTISGKSHSVKLTRDYLRYSIDSKGSHAKSIPIADILSSEVIKSKHQSLSSVLVNFIQKSRKGHWKLGHLTLQHKSEGVTAKWSQQIEEFTNHLVERPRSLLVFVNPVSGKKKGEQNYLKHAAPIFQLAKIKTDVIVTTHATHSEEVLQEYELSTVDGVIVVGGDGTFTQVANGLIRRHAKDHDIPLNDPMLKLHPPPPLRMGIIPSGTGQGMIKVATGLYDIGTAVLHIVSGVSRPIDLLAAYNDRKLLGFGTMLACCGFFGDVIQKSETNRQLGAVRYPYAMLKALVSNRAVNATVHVLPLECENETETAWKEITGPFKVMNTFLFDMSTPVTEWVEYGHSLDVTLVRAVGRFKVFNSMRKMFLGSGESKFEEEHIERCRSRACRFTFQSDAAGGGGVGHMGDEVLNIDGDPHALTHHDVEIRFHSGILRMFGAGCIKLLREGVSTSTGSEASASY